jgi:NhaP-type Na+/H+ or K+/H+ antiporter
MVEMAGIIVFGIIAQWFAHKLKIPSILPLILIGLFVGPISTLISEDGSKWIEPVWNGVEGLFPGERLFNFVSLAIGIILFEGGLTLKKDEILNVGPSIMRLISLGALVTFIGGGVAAHYIWGCCSLYFRIKLADFPVVFGTDHSNRAYGNWSYFKEYSYEKRHICRSEMGRDINRPYWSARCGTGI